MAEERALAVTRSSEALRGTTAMLCWIDIGLAIPLAVPGLSHLFLTTVAWLDSGLGLASVVTTTNAVGMLTMNTTGVVSIFWCIARLRSHDAALIRLDVAGRLIIGLLIASYVWLEGVSVLFMVFFVNLMLGALLEISALREYDDEVRYESAEMGEG